MTQDHASLPEAATVNTQAPFISPHQEMIDHVLANPTTIATLDASKLCESASSLASRLYVYKMGAGSLAQKQGWLTYIAAITNVLKEKHGTYTVGYLHTLLRRVAILPELFGLTPDDSARAQAICTTLGINTTTRDSQHHKNEEVHQKRLDQVLADPESVALFEPGLLGKTAAYFAHKLLTQGAAAGGIEQKQAWLEYFGYVLPILKRCRSANAQPVLDVLSKVITDPASLALTPQDAADATSAIAAAASATLLPPLEKRPKKLSLKAQALALHQATLTEALAHPENIPAMDSMQLCKTAAHYASKLYYLRGAAGTVEDMRSWLHLIDLCIEPLSTHRGMYGHSVVHTLLKQVAQNPADFKMGSAEATRANQNCVTLANIKKKQQLPPSKWEPAALTPSAIACNKAMHNDLVEKVRAAQESARKALGLTGRTTAQTKIDYSEAAHGATGNNAVGSLDATDDTIIALPKHKLEQRIPRDVSAMARYIIDFAGDVQRGRDTLQSGAVTDHTALTEKIDVMAMVLKYNCTMAYFSDPQRGCGKLAISHMLDAVEALRNPQGALETERLNLLRSATTIAKNWPALLDHWVYAEKVVRRLSQHHDDKAVAATAKRLLQTYVDIRERADEQLMIRALRPVHSGSMSMADGPGGFR